MYNIIAGKSDKSEFLFLKIFDISNAFPRPPIGSLGGKYQTI